MEYGRWIVGTAPEDAGSDLESWIEPMAAHPTSPAIIKAANALFGAKSRWISERAGYAPSYLPRLDLYKLHAFKKYVASALGDKKTIGTIRILSKGVMLEAPAFTSNWSTNVEDPLVLPEGTVMKLRVCDVYAYRLELSEIVRTAPSFRIDWPEAERDRAIAELVKWLRAR